MADAGSGFVAWDCELKAVDKSFQSGARVVGATCTKAIASTGTIGRFDMVIIDEASMLIPPAVWLCAGLSTERVVVCGDFRQLPPIVATKQQAIFDALGRDVFALAGLDQGGDNDGRLVMLDVQHRMDPEICNLVAEPMYGGRLRTSIDWKRGSARPLPAPFDRALTLIATSDLWPIEAATAFGSRFNLMHAILVRNLAWHFREVGAVRTGMDFGACTAFAAQARLTEKLVAGAGLGDLPVGTVHSFQGDERRIVVVDVPESHGAKKAALGISAQGVPPSSQGARLFNVAFSRAKENLVVVANVTHLDRRLPSTALLREVLCRMQQRGRVVPGRDVLRLRPAEFDLQGLEGVHCEVQKV